LSEPAVLDFAGLDPSAEDLGPVVRHLREGGVVAYPTETVYGFGGLCTEEAVAALRALKPRGGDRPFLVLVAEAAEVAGLRWTDEARALASVFWPGALTLVLADPDGIFPPGVRSSSGSVAVRVSPHPFVRALLVSLGAGVTSTSANAPGRAPARSFPEVLEAAKKLGAGAELLVVDGGTLTPSEPSTIVDFSGAEPEVVRAGSIPVGRLHCVLPELHER
jgi:L-threonylcarbamoyladenylate synthase